MSFLWALLWNGFGWPEYSAEKGSSFWFSWMYWHSLRARAARRRRAASPHAAGCPRGRPGASRGARGGQRRGARAWRRPPISSSPFCTCSRPPVSGRPHSLLWRASPGSWRRAPARRPPRTSGSGARIRPRARQPAPPINRYDYSQIKRHRGTVRPGLPTLNPDRQSIGRCDGGPRVPICRCRPSAEDAEERLGRLRLSRLAAEMVRRPARARARPPPTPLDARFFGWRAGAGRPRVRWVARGRRSSACSRRPQDEAAAAALHELLQRQALRPRRRAADHGRLRGPAGPRRLFAASRGKTPCFVGGTAACSTPCSRS